MHSSRKGKLYLVFYFLYLALSEILNYGNLILYMLGSLEKEIKGVEIEVSQKKNEIWSCGLIGCFDDWRPSAGECAGGDNS